MYESTNPRVMLFNLASEGHHPIHIQYFVKNWCEEERPGPLDVVVSPAFIERFPEIIRLPSTYLRSNVQFLPVSLSEYSQIKRQRSKARRSFQEWGLLNKYARHVNADRCLIMYFDHLQLGFTLGDKPPCPVSGIYFRPSFHYKTFSGYAPTYKDRLRLVFYWRLLSRALSRSYLNTLFCLDPLATQYIKKKIPHAKILHLPEPVQLYEVTDKRVQEIRRSLQLDSQRKTFLFFGTITRRKGIYALLDVISDLPPNYCEQLCILIVGSTKSSQEAEALRNLIGTIHQRTRARIIFKNDFVPDEDVQSYFKIADVVLAPYQNHVGSSGILVQAAAAAKPVLASDYGLLGEIVRQHRLGLTVEATKPAAIAEGLVACIERHSKLFDQGFAQKFAAENSVDGFTHTLFQYL